MIDWKTLPDGWLETEGVCAVYFLVDGDTVAYIGQTTNLKARIVAHRWARSEVRDGRWTVRYHACRRAELRKLERECVLHYQPRCNAQLRHLVAERLDRKPGLLNLADVMLAYGKTKHSRRDLSAEIGIPFMAYIDLENGKPVNESNLAAVLRWLLS